MLVGALLSKPQRGLQHVGRLGVLLHRHVGLALQEQGVDLQLEVLGLPGEGDHRGARPLHLAEVAEQDVDVQDPVARLRLEVRVPGVDGDAKGLLGEAHHLAAALPERLRLPLLIARLVHDEVVRLEDRQERVRQDSLLLVQTCQRDCLHGRSHGIRQMAHDEVGVGYGLLQHAGGLQVSALLHETRPLRRRSNGLFHIPLLNVVVRHGLQRVPLPSHETFLLVEFSCQGCRLLCLFKSILECLCPAESQQRRALEVSILCPLPKVAGR
mmetsp:Transcript_51276/g.148880  ORF Transcript_51276/g.148880 Transcript_51276/m.148880 type:complete len:269 (+) Transcript_51276:728-1534(+)